MDGTINDSLYVQGPERTSATRRGTWGGDLRSQPHCPIWPQVQALTAPASSLQWAEGTFAIGTPSVTRFKS